MNDTFFGRLGDLVVNPARLMDQVGAAPRWWQAGLLIMVVMMAMTWIVSPIAEPERLEMMRDSRIMRIMPEEQWQQQYQEALSPHPVKRALSAVAAGFFSWVMLIVGGLVLGFFARMSGGEGTMHQAIGIVTWASLISFGLAMLIKLPLIMVTESAFQVQIGLAALLPDPDPSSVLFQFLVNFGDFFSWWALVIIIIGFERVFKLGRGAAVLSVVLPWALAVAAATGVSLMFM